MLNVDAGLKEAVGLKGQLTHLARKPVSLDTPALSM